MVNTRKGKNRDDRPYIPSSRRHTSPPPCPPPTLIRTYAHRRSRNARTRASRVSTNDATSMASAAGPSSGNWLEDAVFGPNSPNSSEDEEEMPMTSAAGPSSRRRALSPGSLLYLQVFVTHVSSNPVTHNTGDVFGSVSFLAPALPRPSSARAVAYSESIPDLRNARTAPSIFFDAPRLPYPTSARPESSLAARNATVVPSVPARLTPVLTTPGAVFASNIASVPANGSAESFDLILPDSPSAVAQFPPTLSRESTLPTYDWDTQSQRAEPSAISADPSGQANSTDQQTQEIAGLKDDLQQLRSHIRDLYGCPFCYDFNATPRIWSCGHISCEKCCEDIRSRTINHSPLRRTGEPAVHPEGALCGICRQPTTTIPPRCFDLFRKAAAFAQPGDNVTQTRDFCWTRAQFAARDAKVRAEKRRQADAEMAKERARQREQRKQEDEEADRLRMSRPTRDSTLMQRIDTTQNQTPAQAHAQSRARAWQAIERYAIEDGQRRQDRMKRKR
ncbi:hypothetical protein EUX98_g7497 [Antrodiella citrinella]|uniref:RING-type domain-containing protein n=1 Tax=Antrodiella citrinella TaxID=2447956 RepID=A0A4S4MLP1_9APHY|nr:hypothetical protein EUX98_g7497 [Antrodiella citrinella]